MPLHQTTAMANGFQEKPDESRKCRILEIGLAIADGDSTPAYIGF